jgi:hypothetical protein
MTEWQPIETADKSRRAVITWNGHDIEMAWYCRHSNLWEPLTLNYDPTLWPQPTHWIDLTPPNGDTR